MSIRKVARLGNPVLRKQARPLALEEIRSSETRRLIEDLVDTLHEYSGIGLAAPQIHESVQVAILEFQADNARYPGMGAQPLLVVINPKITVLDETEQAFWEGCLSVPDLRGLVHRPRKIQVDFLNEQAEAKTIVAEGFLATVFQHELDHLAGKVFLDHVKDTKNVAFLEEYRKYLLPVQPKEELDE